MKRAIITRDGGAGDFHDPVRTTDRFERLLLKNGFETEKHDTLDAFTDAEYLKTFDLIVFSWTLAAPNGATASAIIEAVKSGVGLAGCHGGLCDAFRENTDWQYLTGGQWVAHPGNDGVLYRVNITKEHPITSGIGDFDVKSEQYYLHVDPGVDVLATTVFKNNVCGRDVVMPVVWTKGYGEGRVFYLSVGHTDEVFRDSPESETLMERGMLWAARAL